MQEFYFTIDNALKNGIAPERSTLLNTPFLTAMKELVPTPDGAICPPAITAVSTSLLANFPFPMIAHADVPQASGDYQISAMLLDATAISYLSDTLTAVPITLYNASNPSSTKTIVSSATRGRGWHTAFFQGSYWLTNGWTTVFKLAGNASNKVLASTVLKTGSVVNHNGRLVVATCYDVTVSNASRFTAIFNLWKSRTRQYVDNDMSYNKGYVLWCEPAGFTSDYPMTVFAAMVGLLGDTEHDKYLPLIRDAIDNGLIGMCPTRSKDENLCIKQLGNDLIVYGVRNITRLIPTENGYSPVFVKDIQIASRGAVSGDQFEHVFTAEDGCVWRWLSGEQQPIPLHYEYIFSGWTTTSIQHSFDPIKRYHWISDGNYCYVLTPWGLGGPVCYIPTSLARIGQYLMGPFRTLTDKEIQITSHPIDLQNRNRKTLSSVQVQATGIVDLSASAEFRDSALSATSWANTLPWRSVPKWFSFNPSGVSYPICSFVEGKLKLKGTLSAISEIQRIEVRYNADDTTHNRGTRSNLEGD